MRKTFGGSKAAIVVLMAILSTSAKSQEAPNLDETVDYLTVKIKASADVVTMGEKADTVYKGPPLVGFWQRKSQIRRKDPKVASSLICESMKCETTRERRVMEFDPITRKLDLVKKEDVVKDTLEYEFVLSDLDPDVKLTGSQEYFSYTLDRKVYSITVRTTDSKKVIKRFRIKDKNREEIESGTEFELWMTDEKAATAIHKALIHAITLAGGKKSKGSFFEK